MHREGLGPSLSSVTSRFCLLTGQPCSHYCEHRLAGTRALCKSPGFVLLPLNKRCVFPAWQCMKGFSSPRRPQRGGRGASYLHRVPIAHPTPKPHWGWVMLNRIKDSSKRCWGLQDKESTRQEALGGAHCGVSRHQKRGGAGLAGCVQGYPQPPIQGVCSASVTLPHGLSPFGSLRWETVLSGYLGHHTCWSSGEPNPSNAAPLPVKAASS